MDDKQTVKKLLHIGWVAVVVAVAVAVAVAVSVASCIMYIMHIMPCLDWHS